MLVGVGGMAAILGLDDAGVAAACREAAQGQVVEPVNFNAPSQVVIAGNKEAVERAVVAAKARGAKRAVVLPVSAPFTVCCSDKRQRPALRLVGVPLSAPAIPVLHNVDVAEHVEPGAIRGALAQQAASPVRWAQTVQAFAARGMTHVVECGPGKVLSGLTRRIVPDLESYALTDSEAITTTVADLAAAP